MGIFSLSLSFSLYYTRVKMCACVCVDVDLVGMQEGAISSKNVQLCLSSSLQWPSEKHAFVILLDKNISVCKWVQYIIQITMWKYSGVSEFKIESVLLLLFQFLN